MNLLCPNCQKMLQVPEQYAGQLMKCPLCTGTFTVPALPPQPSAPPPPPMVQPQDQYTAAPPQPDYSPGPDLSQGPPPAGYTHQRSYILSPRLLAWLAPLCLLAIFGLLFLPWVGMYPAGISAVTQTGWNAAFGGYSDNEVWRDANREDLDYLKNLKLSLMLVFYLLILLPTLVIAIGSTLIHLRLVPVELPPSLAGSWSYRPLLVALLCLAGLVFLSLQLFSGFSLESATWEQADAMAKKLPGYKEPATPEQRIKFELDKGKEYGKFNLTRTSWLTIALVLQVAALLFALIDYWAERRGPAAPAPRIDILT